MTAAHDLDKTLKAESPASGADTATVLVVDDSPDLMMLTCMLLREQGFGALGVGTGRAAMEVLQSEVVDAVMLDLHMPGVGGMEVLTSIRGRWSRSELPVLIYTADPNQELAARSLRAGANDHVSKMVGLDELAARVQTQIELSRELRRPQTGQHSRLKPGAGRLIHRARTTTSDPAGVCPGCQRLLLWDAPACPICEGARPEDGWIPLDDVDVPRLGDVLGGRYVLTRRLGAGTTGVVYEALDADLDRRFAIKMVDLSRFDPVLQRHVTTEVKTMARLSNPHVVRIYEALRVEDGVIALVMDYAPGRTLAELLDYHGALSPELGLEIVRQLAQALYEVHDLGLIHRDIKPENIMVEELRGGRYFVRLLDFGIAMPSLSRMRESAFFGTPLYAAPEQCDPQISLDHRCDIYALGAVLYRLLSGRPPYVAETFEALMAKHLSAPVPLLPEVGLDEGLRAELQELLGDLLAKHRALRPEGMVEVMARLDALVGALSTGHAEPREAGEGRHGEGLQETVLARPFRQGERSNQLGLVEDGVEALDTGE